MTYYFDWINVNISKKDKKEWIIICYYNYNPFFIFLIISLHKQLVALYTSKRIYM